jgi:hypothetical protein
MSFSDYLINGLLIALVLIQIRGRRLTARNLLLPLGIVGYAATHYLHSIPTAGNDLLLIVAGATVGLTLGVLDTRRWGVAWRSSSTPPTVGVPPSAGSACSTSSPALPPGPPPWS